MAAWIPGHRRGPTPPSGRPPQSGLVLKASLWVGTGNEVLTAQECRQAYGVYIGRFGGPSNDSWDDKPAKKSFLTWPSPRN